MASAYFTGYDASRIRMAPTSAFAYVLRRSLGETAPGEFIHTWHAEASRDLQLNQAKVLHKQGMNIWHMDLEAAEDRYLLVGTGMGALHLYDVAALDVPGVVAADIKPLCSIKPLRGKLPMQQLQVGPRWLRSPAYDRIFLLRIDQAMRRASRASAGTR